uniref:suppressor of Mek1-like n=1 Tax=Erigeron canadensis TaxID=72917 RepID=UPI001CB99FFC|nr:suppressor of Mek1-like [Erigeron canadensis]
MSATAITLSTAEKPIRRFPPPCWTQEEALSLIQAYRDRWYALRRGYLRTADWDAVAEDVGRLYPANPPKTSAQCRHKIEKLRQRYRAEKQRALSFPGGQFVSTWFYFEAMDSMEKNGNGSNPGEENGMDSGLNPGRGIRFKPVPVSVDHSLVTIASRSNNNNNNNNNNFRASNNSYVVQEDDDIDIDDEIEHGYYIQPPPISSKNLGKSHKLPSVNYQDFDGARARKFSKTGSNSTHSYWNENVDVNDDDDDGLEEDEVWVKMPKDRNSASKDKYGDRGYRYVGGESEKRGVKRENDSIGQIVASIKDLADGFVNMEKMKMEMVREIEKMRMDAEMKRNELLLQSQKQIVEAFVKGLAENKKQEQQ